MSERVRVVDSRNKSLSSCPRDRADKLVDQGKARWLDQEPPTIQLLRQIDIPEPEPPPEPLTLAGQRILLHICCGPCATYTVKRLRELDAEVVGYWFNPNIQPYSEHERRRETLAALADQIDLQMLWEPGYETTAFLRGICGHERFGERCAICYRQRLERTAQRAAEHSCDAFSTTLLISPYQDVTCINALGQTLAQAYDVGYYHENFRRGFAEHHKLANQFGLYQQRYCGCLYSEWEALDRDAPNGRRGSAHGRRGSAHGRRGSAHGRRGSAHGQPRG